MLCQHQVQSYRSLKRFQNRCYTLDRVCGDCVMFVTPMVVCCCLRHQRLFAALWSSKLWITHGSCCRYVSYNWSRNQSWWTVNNSGMLATHNSPNNQTSWAFHHSDLLASHDWPNNQTSWAFHNSDMLARQNWSNNQHSCWRASFLAFLSFACG